MPVHQNAVGEKTYAWTLRAGGPTPGVAECVISAHGRQCIINPGTVLQNVQFIFYSPHGYALNDPGLAEVLTGGVRPSGPPVAAAQCQDYVLSKWQGRHGAGDAETYGTIGAMEQTFVDNASRASNNLLNALNRVLNPPVPGAPRQGPNLLNNMIVRNQALVDRWAWRMDIISIRNRLAKKNPMLSEVVADLHAAGYGYTRIHCCFCRCSINPFAQSYNAPVIPLPG